MEWLLSEKNKCSQSLGVKEDGRPKPIIIMLDNLTATMKQFGFGGVSSFKSKSSKSDLNSVPNVYS